MILPPQVPIIMHNRADSTMNNMEEIMDRLNIVFVGKGDRHEAETILFICFIVFAQSREEKYY